jgi:hypothetical protein
MQSGLPTAKYIPDNHPVLAMWLVLTTFNCELQQSESHLSGFNWEWFYAFCTELRITSIFTLVNVKITRAEESPLWSKLSLQTRQFISSYFGMTPQDVVDEVSSVVMDLCTHSHFDMSEETQRAVVTEIYLQGRMAINNVPWCEHSLGELLRLQLPEPHIKW